MTMHDHDQLHPHSHDPNPQPPLADPTLLVSIGEVELSCTVEMLRTMPQSTLDGCYIVSTGHGTSGPFTFAGPMLETVVQQMLAQVEENRYGGEWTQVEVISADGFGTRVSRTELENSDPAGAIIAAIEIGGQPMAREEGLVRLIVPSERDDALRQVKWVGKINVR